VTRPINPVDAVPCMASSWVRRGIGMVLRANLALAKGPGARELNSPVLARMPRVAPVAGYESRSCSFLRCGPVRARVLVYGRITA
jgi:hypothetical protein